MTESSQPPSPSPPTGPPPPGAGVPAGPAQPQNGVAIAALVVGLVSLLIWFIGVFVPFVGPVFSALVGAVAVVLAIIGRKTASDNPSAGRGGMAIAGLITGLITILLSVLVLVGCGLLVGAGQRALEDLEQEAAQREVEKKDSGGKKSKR